MAKAKMKVGDVIVSERGNTEHVEWTVIEYVNSRNVTVKSNNGCVLTCGSWQIRDRKDTMIPTVFGVGYFGVGPFKSETGLKKNQKTPEYSAWKHMLERCYCLKRRTRPGWYHDGCSVSEEFLNFQSFAEWFVPLYKPGHVVDKDILVPGNKVYSKDTCLVVPKSINGLVVTNLSRRGDYPVGVHFCKNRDKFIAQVNKGTGAPTNLGGYFSVQDAFDTHCKHKFDWANELITIEGLDYLRDNIINKIHCTFEEEAINFGLNYRRK